MPNTLTNVKDIKVAQNALQPWMAGLLPLRAFSTNFSPEPADKLDTVRVPVVGAPSQSSEFAGSYTANADSTVSVIPVQLNKHKFKTVHVTAREASEVAGGTFDAYASCNRTCEIGMTRATGHPYQHILEVLDATTSGTTLSEGAP